MRDSELFTSYADRCRREAGETTLGNVRDRSLRAAAAWSAMAVRSASTEAARDAREARPLSEIALTLFGGSGPG